MGERTVSGWEIENCEKLTFTDERESEQATLSSVDPVIVNDSYEGRELRKKNWVNSCTCRIRDKPPENK